MSYYFIGQQGLTSGPVSGSNANFTGTLTVGGASTLAAVSATTLSTSALATLASAAVTAGLTVGTTLGVTGASTLAAVGATTLNTSGLATLASAAVTAGLTVGTTLGVTGTSTLGVLNAGATATTTLSSSGLATLNSASVTTTLGVTGDATAADFIVSPNTGFVRWLASTKLLAQADGTLQVTKSDGTFGTILLGAAGSTTGVAMVSSSNVLQLQKGDGTNSIQARLGSIQAQTTLSANLSNSTNAGLFLGSSTAGHGIVYSGTLGLSYMVGSDGTTATAGYIIGGTYTVAKTGNYTVLVADNGTHFTNDGAAGSVAFTLPTARAGLTYKFTCTAAQIMTVVGSAILGPGSLTGTTRTITGSTAAQRYSSFDVVCFDGTNWVMRAGVGTIT